MIPGGFEPDLEITVKDLSSLIFSIFSPSELGNFPFLSCLLVEWLNEFSLDPQPG